MVTFLLTDVEGSTRLWEEQPDAMAKALADHDALLAEVMRRHGGELLKSRGEGDSTFSVFDDAAGALAAALDGQRELAGGMLRVRMAIHTGDAESRDGDYYGPTVNRCARLRGAAHGGQVVLSLVTRQLAGDRLPDGASLLDLGLHHLRDLTEPERVYQLCHLDLESEFPPLSSLDSRRHNLPAALTHFIGRDSELADLSAALDRTRLVTLVGPGGVGKTRLALEAAGARIDQYRDGVWLVELSAIEQSRQVVPTIATALGLREEAGRSINETLTAHLATRSILVVLDNCEHVIDGAATAAELVLRAGAQVRVLATSRQALGIGGEHVVNVAGLSLPDDTSSESSDAIALFVDRANELNPRFSMNAIDRNSMVEVCRRLDGLPLAIELAAALVDRMSVSEIANRLIERFELLTGGSRTAEPRQRSLTAAIDWSYELLPSHERDAFAALGVFPAGFDLAAADAVLGRAAVETVGQLVAKSLVVHNEGRYSMLETIRAYAAERLAASGRVGQVHDRLVDWALALVEEGDIDRLELEHDNIHAAVRWATDRRPDDALALVNGLGHMWEIRGYWSEGRRHVDDVLQRVSDADAGARARAFHRAGRLASAQGDFADADALLRTALGLAEEANAEEVIEFTLTDLGGVAHMQGDVDEARVHFEAALGIARSMGKERAIAGGLGNLGIIAHATGELAEARALQHEALERARTVGDEVLISRVLGNVAMIETSLGNTEAAIALYDEAHALARRHGSLADIATTLGRLAQLSVDKGDLDTARAQLNGSVSIFWDLGDRANIANGLYRLGEFESSQRRDDAARKALDESLRLWREIGHSLGEAAVLLSLGELDLRAGQPVDASRAFRTALQAMRSLRHRQGIAAALDGIAAVAASRHNGELAAELIGAADAMRMAMGAPDPDRRCVAPQDVRASVGPDAYARACRRGASLSEDQAVELALAAAQAAIGP